MDQVKTSGQSFKILGQKLEYTQERINYLSFYSRHLEMMGELESKVIRCWESKRNLEGVIKELDADVRSLARSYAKEDVKYLHRLGIYTYDESYIMSKCEDALYDYEDYMDDIKDHYQEIMAEKGAAQNYRSARKRSRSRYYGYGLKGSMKAGAKNMMWGAAHSAFNAVGNSVTSLSAGMSMQDVFRSSEIKRNIAERVSLFIPALQMCITEIIDEERVDYFDEVSEDEIGKSMVLMQNIINGVVPKKERVRLAIDALAIDPCEREFIEYLIATYGDSDLEFEHLCQAFSIYNITSFKEKKLIELFPKKVLKNCTEESDLLNLKNDIESKCDYYGYSGDALSGIQDTIKERLTEIDIQLRTYDGVLYESRELAAAVKLDYEKLEKFGQEFNFDNVNLLDQEGYQNTLSIMVSLDYATKEFRQLAVEKAEKILEVEIQRQEHIRKINEAGNPLVEVEQELRTNPVFKRMIPYCSFYRCIKDKRFKKIGYPSNLGTPALLIDTTSSGSWKSGVCVATGGVYTWDESTNHTYSLSEVEGFCIAERKLCLRVAEETIPLRKVRLNEADQTMLCRLLSNTTAAIGSVNAVHGENLEEAVREADQFKKDNVDKYGTIIRPPKSKTPAKHFIKILLMILLVVLLVFAGLIIWAASWDEPTIDSPDTNTTQTQDDTSSTPEETVPENNDTAEGTDNQTPNEEDTENEPLYSPVDSYIGYYCDIEGYGLSAAIMNYEDYNAVTILYDNGEIMYEEVCEMVNDDEGEPMLISGEFELHISEEGYLSITGCEMRRFNTFYQKEE